MAWKPSPPLGFISFKPELKPAMADETAKSDSGASNIEPTQVQRNQLLANEKRSEAIRLSSITKSDSTSKSSQSNNNKGGGKK